MSSYVTKSTNGSSLCVIDVRTNAKTAKSEIDQNGCSICWIFGSNSENVKDFLISSNIKSSSQVSSNGSCKDNTYISYPSSTKAPAPAVPSANELDNEGTPQTSLDGYTIMNLDAVSENPQYAAYYGLNTKDDSIIGFLKDNPVYDIILGIFLFLLICLIFFAVFFHHGDEKLIVKDANGGTIGVYKKKPE